MANPIAMATSMPTPTRSQSDQTKMTHSTIDQMIAMANTNGEAPLRLKGWSGSSLWSTATKPTATTTP
jgi:hypothetical protein